MKMCGLLGRKLVHSYSPKIHGLLADYPYVLFAKEPEEVEDFIRNGFWTGLNVTIPYKQTVIPFCDELSPLAQEIGSVNTLVRRADGTIYGDNTDAWGFEQMARRLGIDYTDKKVLILGSGGTSLTATTVMRHLGANPVVISRSGKNNYDNLYLHQDAAVVVNTTPLGMYPDVGHSALDLEELPNLEGVLDVLYNPARTKLLMDAEDRGIPYEGGLYMLVAQAVRAAEQFAEITVSQEKLDEVWNTVRSEMNNIVLIGMPGCGKSTIAALLSAITKRHLVEIDDKIEKTVEMPIPDFIRTYGENAFRKVETTMLRTMGSESGLIISTGGGAVTRPENYRRLHQNGTIIWLRRDLNKLPTAGRPISQQHGVDKLFKQRKPLYSQFADIEVDNNGSPMDTVQQIINLLAIHE